MCNRGGGEKEHLNALIKTRPQLCLEVAELQALNQQPMHMRNWIERLDDFLKTGKDILNHAGEISQSMAIEKAEKELKMNFPGLEKILLSILKRPQ